MKKKSRRTFLKSTLALSGAGLALGKSNPAERTQAEPGPGSPTYLSVKDLYKKTVQSAKRREDPSLLDRIIENFDQVLIDEEWILRDVCKIQVQNLINKHKEREKEKGDLTDLKAAVHQDRWRGLREPGEPESWNSACPWQDCPPA